jgi:hypothetical protein
VSWRFDIQQKFSINPIPFEVSKISTGDAGIVGFGPAKWVDTSAYEDSSISCSGFTDLTNNRIYFKSAVLHSRWISGGHGAVDSIVSPPAIIFDSVGNTISFPTSYYYMDLLFGWIGRDTVLPQKIIFPPYTKNVVLQQIQSDLKIHTKDHLIMLNCQTPIGPTTAFLYSVDSRLLKRTKLDISAAGDYSIDVSDVHTHFAFLVLQRGKGVITRKIFLND